MCVYKSVCTYTSNTAKPWRLQVKRQKEGRASFPSSLSVTATVFKSQHPFEAHFRRGKERARGVARLAKEWKRQSQENIRRRTGRVGGVKQMFRINVSTEPSEHSTPQRDCLQKQFTINMPVWWLFYFGDNPKGYVLC